ncbi:MAG: tetratricopeptide repeat protein, partial [Spirochaetota bacterium]
SSGFTIKSGSEIKEFLDLIERVQLGEVNLPEGTRLKKIAEADYVVVGSVSALDAGRQIEADMRMVLPDDCRIVFAAGATGSSSGSAAETIESLIKSHADPSAIRSREKNAPNDASSGLKERITIAVGSFSDSNPESQKSGFAGPFADILNAALAGFDTMTAMDRINAVKIASEKELTMADITYFSPAVRSREFSARDIDYTVSGEIRVLEGLTAISYKVESSHTGSVILAGQQEISTSKGLRAAAYVVAKNIEQGLVRTSGFLRVTTVPNGAAVSVDGEIRGTSPMEIPLSKGKHLVAISQDAYDTAEKEVIIEPRKTAVIKETLHAIDMELLTKAESEESSENWIKSVTTYKELIARYPKTEASLTARYRIGWISLFKLNQTDTAKQYFSDLLAMYPAEYIRTESYFGLASIYEAKGDKENALRLYTMLRKEYPAAVATEEAKKKVLILK